MASATRLMVSCLTMWAVASVGLAQTTQPTKATGPVKIDQSSPKAVMDSMEQAALARDVDAVASCMAPELQKPVAGFFKSTNVQREKMMEIVKLVEEKIDPETATKLRARLGNDGTVEGMSVVIRSATKDGKIDWDQVQIKEEGDQATMSVVSMPGQVDYLRRIDGKWYFTTPPGERVDVMTRLFDAMTKATPDLLKAEDAFIASLKSGQVTKENFDQQFLTFQQSMQDAMRLARRDMMRAMMNSASGPSSRPTTTMGTTTRATTGPATRPATRPAK